MRVFYGIVIFVLILSCIWLYNSKHEVIDQINNQVFISGRIVKVSASGNHCFGIYVIAVDSTTISKFIIASYGHQCPVFQIENNIAEIYCGVSRDDVVGYQLILDGPSKLITIKNRSDSVVVTRSVLSVDGSNINYIKEHTIFNNVAK